MPLLNLIIIYTFISLLQGGECPLQFIEINEECYFKDHIDVLQDFIDLNTSIKGNEPEKLGIQEWKDGRLTYLYLGDSQIETLPEQISLLSDLNTLDLRKNQIADLPSSLCELYSAGANINLNGNQICPPYPYCFEYLGRQNTGKCDTFECPPNYKHIEWECYNKTHIQLLEELIQVNPALEGKKPLDLGREIGYVGWENGKIIHLNLVSNELTVIPESICSIYAELKSFDVSNNLICPPYPDCFDFIGRQNTENCSLPEKFVQMEELEDAVSNQLEFSGLLDIHSLNAHELQNDLEVLQSIIDANNSLVEMQPLEIGKQKWENLHLVALDLSFSELTRLPDNICSIYSNLTNFDLSGNSICPPYPDCIDFIGNQVRGACVGMSCPGGYVEVEGECYFEEHLNFLQDLISGNPSLEGIKPLEIGTRSGVQNWQNGKLTHLILSGNQLSYIPESVCTIYPQLQGFDVSNNSICLPYPVCIENRLGYQNTENCGKGSCPEGYVDFDDNCYFYGDLQVLIDFTHINKSIESFHPLLFGHQVWRNNRLQILNLDGVGITSVPESIQNLNSLTYLNLNNNQLEVLPDELCEIYPELKGFGTANNQLCPPYLDCFDYIGYQNTENCEHQYCPYGFIEIAGVCYNQKDVEVLQDFIDANSSLSGRNPLDIGVQKWRNMRLDFLYLGVNDLTGVPESICSIFENVSEINISGNKICPPYPACVEEFMGEQDTSGCP